MAAPPPTCARPPTRVVRPRQLVDRARSNSDTTLVQTATVIHTVAGRVGVIASLPSPSSPFVFHACAWPRAGTACASPCDLRRVAACATRATTPSDRSDIAASVAIWAIPFGIAGRASTTSSRTTSSTGASRARIRRRRRWTRSARRARRRCARSRDQERAGLASRLWSCSDVMAPALVAAQAIGRWGNYFNQELFGGPTSLPWGVRIDAAHRPCGYETFTTFHPAFLYESLWDACVLLGLLWFIPRVLGRARAGTIFFTYLAAYAAGRLVLESMRVDFAHRLIGLRVNQWVFGATFLLAASTAALLFLRSRRVLRGSGRGCG